MLKKIITGGKIKQVFEIKDGEKGKEVVAYEIPHREEDEEEKKRGRSRTTPVGRS